jgi:hypothetical protein
LRSSAPVAVRRARSGVSASVCAPLLFDHRGLKKNFFGASSAASIVLLTISRRIIETNRAKTNQKKADSVRPA